MSPAVPRSGDRPPVSPDAGGAAASALERFERLAGPPIFVVGKHRSGTTWVHEILLSHPQVAGVFESWLFSERSGLGALLAERNWNMAHTGLAQLMDRADAVADLRHLSMQWLGRALEPHHRFLAEKSPGPHIGAILEIFPEARFIHCIRDGRDVTVSIKAAAKSWAPQWSRTMGKSTLAAARSWRSVVETLRAADCRPDQMLEVRYEALRADPMAGYRRIFDFCGIPYDDEILEEVFAETDFDQVHAGGEDEFRRGARVGDWQQRFSALDAVLFELGAGSLLRSEGYAGRTWWLRHILVGRRRASGD